MRAPLRAEYLDTVDSTNTAVKLRAAQGESEGLVIAAGAQCAGRGRLGRSFFSPAGTGVYFSLLLRPKLPPDEAVFITSAAAVAVCRGIEAVAGRECGIKWVNDVFIGGRKVCGILTEAVFGKNGLDCAVLGIGINLSAPKGGFPCDIGGTAGSVFGADMPDGAGARIIAACLNEFWGFYTRLPDMGFLREYRERSLIVGREINVLSPGGDYPALALDIDDRCRLTVQRPDGRTETLSSGEISIRLKSPR